MAFRSSNYWRTMVNRLGLGGNRTMTTSTAPRRKPYAPALDSNLHHTKPSGVTGEYVPVYVTIGLVLLALSFAGVSAKQHLAYDPSVHVSKKKRSSFPEFSDPDYVVDETEKLVKRSFFRKIAHMKEMDRPVANPIWGDVYNRPVQAETLKSVGVDPTTPL